MYIDRASASAVKAYKFCAFQYWLTQVLGMESPSGKSAVLGNVVHQVFEWLGEATRRGKALDPARLLDWAWDQHTRANARLGLRRETRNGESADFRLCRTSVEKVLAHPFYDLRRLKVLGVEKRFDIELPGSLWTYIKSDKTEAQFRVTGYIDLVHEVNADTIEVVDWKTGKRQDWGTMEEKDFYDFMRDVQPRLYHVAASQLFPQYRNILVTFFFINDGGPLTLPFAFEDMALTLGSIWRFFDVVRRDVTLQRNRCWKCSRFCHFGRNGICDRVWGDLHAYGEEHVESRFQGLTAAQQQAICPRPSDKTDPSRV